MGQFSQEIIADFRKDVMDAPGVPLDLKLGTILILPIGEYKKYISDYHHSASTQFETFENRGYGFVIGSGVPEIKKGDCIYYLPMLGAPIHLNPDIDVHVKVLEGDQWLIKEANNE